MIYEVIFDVLCMMDVFRVMIYELCSSFQGYDEGVYTGWDIYYDTGRMLIGVRLNSYKK